MTAPSPPPPAEAPAAEQDDLDLANQATGSASVGVGASHQALNEDVEALLIRVVVDLHVDLPGTFELVFRDPELDVLGKAGITLATKILIKGPAREGGGEKPLLDGEVTAIEGSYGDRVPLTIVRGSTMDHRMQRISRSRTFIKAKDSDVARQLAGDSGLTVGAIDATSQTHPQLSQENQTDWAFLRERAEEIGYEVGVAEGKFHFRKASTASSGTPIELHMGQTLTEFRPRVSAAGLVSEVEVRAWDPVNAKAVAVKHAISSTGVSLGIGDAASAVQKFGTPAAPAPAANAELGPEPSTKARVVFDRAMTVDDSSTQALSAAAAALADQASSGFAEAEGETLGDSRVIAGVTLKIADVPDQFAGKWTVTRARHVFDQDPYAKDFGGGYRTWFTAAGHQDRTLLALTGGGGNNRGPTRIQGVVGAVVTDIDDPLGLARVKVALPWLSPSYVTNWAPVAQLSAGKKSGAMFLPEPGDEVLVAFEFGDLRKPYVLGAVVNKRTGSGGVIEPGGNQPGKAAVKAGQPASVIRRGIITPSGSRLLFHDDGPPGGGQPTAAKVVLATKDDKIGLEFDQVGATMKLTCKPGSKPGTLSIESFTMTR
jgi:phage protein D